MTMTLCYTYRIGSIRFAVLWILNGDLTATFEMNDVKYGEHWWTLKKNPIKYALFMINKGYVIGFFLEGSPYLTG